MKPFVLIKWAVVRSSALFVKQKRLYRSGIVFDTYFGIFLSFYLWLAQTFFVGTVDVYWKLKVSFFESACARHLDSRL